MLYVTQGTWQRSSCHALCMHLQGYMDLRLCHTNTFESSSAVFTAEISANISSYNLLSTQGKQKWFLSLCPWMLPASPSHELHQQLIHIPVTWNTGTHPVTAISSNIIQPLDNIIHQESGNRSFFGSTLHSCI